VKLRNVLFAAALAALAHAPQSMAQGWGYGPYGPAMGYPMMPDYRTTGPAQLLEDALERLKTFFSGDQPPPPQVIARFVDEQIAPYFDFEGMAEWIARPYYERMSPAERAELTAKVKEAFLGILARELGAFAKPQPQVSFYRARPAGRGQIEVPARVLPANGYPIRLTFRFRQGDDGWKVIDVSSNGLSAVQYLRQQFIQMIRGYAAPRRPYATGPGYRGPATGAYGPPAAPRP
jgi:phospholipid transport system substrate-binding protein